MRILYFIAMLTIFSACKDKDPVVDKCSNGFVDAGENGVDCGGNCPPCAPYEPETAYIECNGKPISFPTKSILYQNNIWSLTMSNDTFSLQVNLGSNGAIGAYPLNSSGNIASKNGIYYLNGSNGNYSISAHNTTSHKMSGFFQMDISRTGYTDTLKIRNGQFEFVPY